MLIALLSLYALSVAGGVIWLFNVEAAAILYGANLGYPAPVVGVVCAAGQATAYTLLFLFSGWLLPRWRWAQRQTEALLRKYGERIERSFLIFTATAAFIGLPPMTGMAIVAPGFRVRLPTMLAIAFSLRVVRFTILAAFGLQLAAWWKTLW